VTFINEVKRLAPNMIITQPVYGSTSVRYVLSYFSLLCSELMVLAKKLQIKERD
jgi:hypothetical protein